MLKICLMSDNHGDLSSILEILHDNPDCDYYFHMGDSSLDEKDIKPFISVKGNNDYLFDYPKQRIIELKNHRILLIHGTNIAYSLSNLALKAKKEECDVVIFGHIHRFIDEIIDDIRLINPGSTYYNRDQSPPSYAIMYIDDENDIKVERINLE